MLYARGVGRHPGQEVLEAVALSNGRDMQDLATYALAIAGETAHATRLAHDLVAGNPTGRFRANDLDPRHGKHSFLVKHGLTAIAVCHKYFLVTVVRSRAH